MGLSCPMNRFARSMPIMNPGPNPITKYRATNSSALIRRAVVSIVSGWIAMSTVFVCQI